VFVACLVSGQFYYFDSLSAELLDVDAYENDTDLAFGAWKYFAKNFDRKLKWTNKEIDYVKQQDGISCGFFVCFFVNKLLSSDFAGLKVLPDLETFRHYIYNTMKPLLKPYL
jgi:hypothetical protein